MGMSRVIPRKGVRGSKEIPLHSEWAKGRRVIASTNTNQLRHGRPRRPCLHRRTHQEGSHCKAKDKKDPLTMAREADGAAEGWMEGVGASRHRTLP